MVITKAVRENVRAGPEERGATEGVSVQDVLLSELYLPCPHCRTLGTDKAVECRVCGLIFAKWRARRAAPTPEPPVWKAASASFTPSRVFWKLWLGAAALAILMSAVNSSPSLETQQSDFQTTVLGASNPTLVMFNIAPRCGCAEEELVQLNDQWKGSTGVYTMNAVDSPALAAQFGVTNHATVLLFNHGQLVRKADAYEMEQAVKARHGGEWDSADMKAQLEAFVELNEPIPAVLAGLPPIEGYPHLFVLDENGKLLTSKETGDLESGESYDPGRFSEFLKTWAPS